MVGWCLLDLAWPGVWRVLMQRMYVGNLAHVDGTNPASGAYTYYLQDHLGSTRYVYDQSKNLVGEFEYTPYGGAYLDGGAADVTARFTGHRWDSRSGLYFAPYRYYSPVAGRWVSRDPLGMVDGPNVYGYVRGNPVRHVDPEGRFVDGISIGAVLVALAGALALITYVNTSDPPDTRWLDGFGDSIRKALESLRNLMGDKKHKPSRFPDDVKEKMRKNPQRDGESPSDWAERLFPGQNHPGGKGSWVKKWCTKFPDKKP